VQKGKEGEKREFTNSQAPPTRKKEKKGAVESRHLVLMGKLEYKGKLPIKKEIKGTPGRGEKISYHKLGERWGVRLGGTRSYSEKRIFVSNGEELSHERGGEN